MRLLELKDTSNFGLTEDFVGDNIPQYAILSHTWGTDSEEVTFRDLVDGTNKDKAGYKKIQFCSTQAANDGLRYFWVDTCCIDKSNNTELSEAINSMFRWYRNAVKCYAYLSDVSRPVFDETDQFSGLSWESAFRKSRWFTRGWTLQELIAPESVEFFSVEGTRLGDNKSLEQHIHEITGIPVEALRGIPLSHFSVPQRISWAEQRETKREEDKAYSLMGIFDIHMPLIYGEGRKNAFIRLLDEIDKHSESTIARTVARENQRIPPGSMDFSISFSLSQVFETGHFVARQEELAEIHKRLSGESTRRIVVLHGLGGIGKTQLTVAYVKRHKIDYSAILWLNIKDEDSLKQSFAKIARQVLREHPSANRLSGIDLNGNLDEVVDAVKEWLSLSENSRWLMVFDNYDNPKLPGTRDHSAVDINKFLPEAYHGSIIITTRSSKVKMGHQLRVGKMKDIQHSLEILSHTSGREELVNDADAKALAEELDGLPLALATAGAYLDQVATTFSDYLRLYRTSWLKLQQTSPDVSWYEDRALYSTWQLSFDHVKQQNELSAKLLQLWAYFDNQDVWYELLQHGNSNDPEWFSRLIEDELSFNEAVRVLCDHGLVEADINISSEEQLESMGYSMHGCVHSWTIHVLNQKSDYTLAQLALKCIAAHIPAKDASKSWLTQRRLLQHAGRCWSVVMKDTANVDGMEWALHSLANLYTDQDKLDEAEKIYQRALQEYEKGWGLDHTSTLATVNNLGVLYKNQGKLDEAEKMYLRTLQGIEKTWGPDHTSTLLTVHNLGNLYHSQGKLDEAEKMYQRALQGMEKAWGLDHTTLLMTINNLGVLYYSQNKWDEAEKMYQRALQGYENAWGPGNHHTSTLGTVHNLGNLYYRQGKLDEAEKMLQRALQGREKILGLDHPSTVGTISNLGNLYTDQGKLDKAEMMLQRALQGREKILGPDHTSTLNTINNLGIVYEHQGKLDESEKMLQRALQGREKILGTNHASTLSVVYRLGRLYRDLFYEKQKKMGILKLTTSSSTQEPELFNQKVASLASLCQRYFLPGAVLFEALGRGLLWAGDDDNSIVAFEQRITKHDAGPNHDGIWCDGCGKELNFATVRYVCKACKDTDLCEKCHEVYDRIDLQGAEAKTPCQGHEFVAVPRAEWYMLEPGTISQDGMTVTMWLEGLSVRFSQPQP